MNLLPPSLPPSLHPSIHPSILTYLSPSLPPSLPPSHNQKIDMSGTGVFQLQDMGYLKDLPLLENLDLRDTPLFVKSKSLDNSSCMRLQVLYLLGHPQGKCKVNTLNLQLVTAEEMASAANFHDPKHAQYQDTKRDDAQDLPPALFL